MINIQPHFKRFQIWMENCKYLLTLLNPLLYRLYQFYSVSSISKYSDKIIYSEECCILTWNTNCYIPLTTRISLPLHASNKMSHSIQSYCIMPANWPWYLDIINYYSRHKTYGAEAKYIQPPAHHQLTIENIYNWYCFEMR